MLPLIVPEMVPAPDVLSTAMPLYEVLGFTWMLLLAIVSVVVPLPAGLITTPPPRTPVTVLVSMLVENVTLLVPVAVEPAENWK